MAGKAKYSTASWTPAKRAEAAQSGRRGARNRWGPPRILRLDTLDPVSREIIAAILTARENAAKAAAVAEPDKV
jgi:hypothetical protein